MVLEIEFSYLWEDKYAWRVKHIDRNILKKDFKDYDLQVYVTNYTFLSNNMLSLGLKSEDKINVCSKYEKELIENKVKLINNKYNQNKIERCKEEEIYWYIDTDFVKYPFNIQCCEESYSSLDTKLFGMKNYFKTKEQAQRKLDKLIRCFYED